MNTFQTFSRLSLLPLMAAFLPLWGGQAWATPRSEWLARHGMDSAEFRWPVQPNDLAANLVDRLEVTRLDEMDRRKLTSASLPDAPWSDTYWPIYLGGIAQRYADPSFPSGSDFDAIDAYVRGSSCSIAQLSPAEKYDLLVGDRSHGLRNAMLDNAKASRDENGRIESWTGYCHGWAPASFMMARPQAMIEVLAADGRTRIPFYPSDIKALATTLWSNANFPTRFIGGRCNDRDPRTDRDGRAEDGDCLDTNPATWHLSIVNQIGVARRSFVMDATWRYEVWNQPVVSYELKYFNPATRAESATAAGAKVAVENFRSDPRRDHRSPGTAALVGVEMDVTYLAETSPEHRERDLAEYDRHSSMTLRYTLEIAADGELLGGEWESDSHPDFLWVPAPGARAESYWDRGLTGEWREDAPVPAAWGKAAALASSRQQLPLAKIVEGLIARSRLAR